MPYSPTYFTIEEANALVPRLRQLMSEQMDRRSEIEHMLDQLSAKLGGMPGSIQPTDGDPPDVHQLKTDIVERLERYRSGWREIESLGPVLKDPRLGLLDFYGHVDGQLVWLCWKYGEDAVCHYHGIDEGFAQRRPIEPTTRRRHLN